MTRTLTFALLAAMAAACAGTPAVYQPPAMPDGEIVVCPDNTPVPFPVLIRDLADDRIVYVGEFHNNDHHHAFQYQVIRALHEQGDDLLIGMEMFHRPFQPVLDAFVAGSISEERMLRDTEYFSRWKWDYRYYRPILLFAREHGIPIIALNAPSEANRRVSRGGGLEALTDEDRKWVAKDIDLDIEEHRAMFEETMSGHPMPPSFNLDAFYASQCLWEDTMAESAVLALRARPGSKMVVLVGGRHVENGVGIPLRVKNRGISPGTVILGFINVPPAELEAYVHSRPAHYLVITENAPETAPSPKLGISVDTEATKPGVTVEAAAPPGFAARAGVVAGDRIVAIDRWPICTLDDLKIALALMPGPGGTLTVMREYLRLNLPFGPEKSAP